MHEVQADSAALATEPDNSGQEGPVNDLSKPHLPGLKGLGHRAGLAFLTDLAGTLAGRILEHASAACQTLPWPLALDWTLAPLKRSREAFHGHVTQSDLAQCWRRKARTRRQTTYLTPAQIRPLCKEFTPASAWCPNAPARSSYLHRIRPCAQPCQRSLALLSCSHRALAFRREGSHAAL